MSIAAADHKALTLLSNHPDRFAAQGTVVETWRTCRGRRLGPYYRLAWRENRRQRSVYLGRQGALVKEVRRLLQEAQASRRIRREHRRRAALFREQVSRPIRQYIKEMFRLFGNGLYIKGSEIRGIRTAGPRLTAADVPQHLIPEFPLPLPSFLAELHPHTNPMRQRGQKPPSSNSPPHHHTPEFPKSVDQNPSYLSVTHLSVINHTCHTPHHHTPEFPNSVDQNPSYLSVTHLSVINHTRHTSEFPKSVDQNPSYLPVTHLSVIHRPRTTRGPPTQPTSETAQIPKEAATNGSRPSQPLQRGLDSPSPYPRAPHPV